MNDYTVTLVPKHNNGRLRWVRVNNTDWDNALMVAEEHNPNWSAAQAGPVIEGAEIVFYQVIEG